MDAFSIRGSFFSCPKNVSSHFMRPFFPSLVRTYDSMHLWVSNHNSAVVSSVGERTSPSTWPMQGFISHEIKNTVKPCQDEIRFHEYLCGTNILTTKICPNLHPNISPLFWLDNALKTGSLYSKCGKVRPKVGVIGYVKIKK
jgi:hypothetical protein